jgi:hypothetical protein
VARSVDMRLENLERLVVHGEPVGCPAHDGARQSAPGPRPPKYA